MPILADDLKLIACERPGEQDDSGGLPGSHALLDNVENELFPDIASGDTVPGRTWLTKFFPAVRTASTDAYLASYLYIDAPPTETGVTCGLLLTGQYADTRAQALEKLYVGAQQSTNTNLRLYQNYDAEASVLSFYYLHPQTLPYEGRDMDNGGGGYIHNGDVLFLEDAGANVSQYVKVTSVVYTWTPTGGSLSITLAAPLRFALRGLLKSDTNYVTPTQLYKTRAIPVAHSLYGITALARTALAQATELTLASLRNPIAPTVIEAVPCEFRPQKGTLTPRSVAITAVDSRYQSVTLSPVPTDATGITARMLLPTGPLVLNGAAHPGKITLSGAVATVDFGASPLQKLQRDWALADTPLSTVNTSAETLRFQKVLKASTITVQAARTSDGQPLANADNGSGAFPGTAIGGTLSYATGAITLSFASPVRRESLTVAGTEIVTGTWTPSGNPVEGITTVAGAIYTNTVPGSLTWSAVRVSDGAVLSGTTAVNGVISGTGLTSGTSNANGSFTLQFAAAVFASTVRISTRYEKPFSVTLSANEAAISSYTATLPAPLTAVQTTVRGLRADTGEFVTATADAGGTISGGGISGSVVAATGALSLTFTTPLIRSSLVIGYEQSTALSPVTWEWDTQTSGTSFHFLLPAERGIDRSGIQVTAVATTGGAVLSATTNASGVLSGDATGTATTAGDLGVVFTVAVNADSIRVGYRQYIVSPVNALLGGSLDAVRLPPDKSFPLVRAGDAVLIHYPLRTALPTPLSGGTTHLIGRPNVDRLWLEDAIGTKLSTTLYTVNRGAGSVTMAPVIDLSTYQMPIYAHSTLEEDALVTGIDENTRTVRITPELSRSYPAGVAYLSSMAPIGDVYARASAPFSQQAWSNVWQDSRVGDPITGQFNHAAYPVEVSNTGTITERWRIQFTSTTTVNVIGEVSGQVATGLSITADLAPINPQTGTPYFRLRYQGFSAGFVNGNLVRFNTIAADVGVWALRCKQIGEHIPGLRRSFSLTWRGDTNA